MSELPPLVDATWLQEHLAEDDLLVGDVRGPNAHQRGHLPRSIPLVLGSPPPLATRETVQEFAVEVQRRLGRHGVTGQERLVLYDRGDCVGVRAGEAPGARKLRVCRDELRSGRLLLEEAHGLGRERDVLPVTQS